METNIHKHKPIISGYNLDASYIYTFQHNANCHNFRVDSYVNKHAYAYSILRNLLKEWKSCCARTLVPWSFYNTFEYIGTSIWDRARSSHILTLIIIIQYWCCTWCFFGCVLTITSSACLHVCMCVCVFPLFFACLSNLHRVLFLYFTSNNDNNI